MKAPYLAGDIESICTGPFVDEFVKVKTACENSSQAFAL